MDDPKVFIKSALMALIQGDDSTAQEEFSKAIEIKSSEVIDMITVNSDWGEEE